MKNKYWHKFYNSGKLDFKIISFIRAKFDDVYRQASYTYFVNVHIKKHSF